MCSIGCSLHEAQPPATVDQEAVTPVRNGHAPQLQNTQHCIVQSVTCHCRTPPPSRHAQGAEYQHNNTTQWEGVFTMHCRTLHAGRVAVTRATATKDACRCCQGWTGPAAAATPTDQSVGAHELQGSSTQQTGSRGQGPQNSTDWVCVTRWTQALHVGHAAHTPATTFADQGSCHCCRVGQAPQLLAPPTGHHM